jgi:hypothetical protein
MIRRLLAVPALAAAMLAVGGPATASAGTMTLGAYSGLGAWIDIYDGNLMKTPDRTAAALKARGVNTIYLETGNSSAKDAFVRPGAAASLIQSAHRRGMKVVAWYLPTLVDQGKDQRRALGAIRFRTPLGQSFDGFALDIESSAVHTVSTRNARLLAVSAYLRRWAPSGAKLGAIIPAPRGMQLSPTYWPNFPYADLGLTYDVILPMGYFSYRPTDLGGAYGYTVRNVALIRRGTGDPEIPIHIIGGVGDDVSAAQVNAFVRATRDCGVAGASLYDFTTTVAGGWKYLRGVRLQPGTPKSSCL